MNNSSQSVKYYRKLPEGVRSKSQRFSFGFVGEAIRKLPRI